jgi:hypothetical protein
LAGCGTRRRRRLRGSLREKRGGGRASHGKRTGQLAAADTLRFGHYGLLDRFDYATFMAYD